MVNICGGEILEPDEASGLCLAHICPPTLLQLKHQCFREGDCVLPSCPYGSTCLGSLDDLCEASRTGDPFHDNRAECVHYRPWAMGGSPFNGLCEGWSKELQSLYIHNLLNIHCWHMYVIEDPKADYVIFDGLSVLCRN